MTELVSTQDVEVAPARTGLRLAAARESCGLSVADIARQLKLSPWQIEALEADNYARLPGPVFVRGFLRNYARLVKIDPALLLADAELQLPSSTRSVPELPPSVEIPFPSGREFNWHKYAIAALVLLVPVVIFEFYRDDTTEVAPQSRQVALPPPQVVAAETAVETSVGPQVSAGSDAAVKSARTGPAATRVENNAMEKPVIAARTMDTEYKPGEHRVRLRFDRDSWVEIRDRNGRKIFSQLSPAGTEQVISGQPPLTLVVGNAVGVHLTHNDQLIDLAPYTKVDVARLTLE
jgi:cytoskeleton protein RodZ